MSKKVKKKAAKSAARPAARKPAKKAAKPGGKKPARATAKASTAMRDRAAAMFGWAHGITAKYAEPFNADNATRQPLPTSNHALWSLGHLAISNEWFASLIDGKPAGVTDAQDKLFGMGSSPNPSADAYPSFVEIKSMFDASATRMQAAVKGLSDEDLLAPCASDTGGFCTDKLDALLKAAWHEGWHLGQIAELRKAFGLIPAKK